MFEKTSTCEKPVSWRASGRRIRDARRGSASGIGSEKRIRETDRGDPRRNKGTARARRCYNSRMTSTNEKKELFENTPVPRALLKMAVPTIVSQLINLVYNLVDTIYIGQTGDAYKTAAVTLAFTVFMMTVSFSNLFGVGGGSLIARLSGRGETDQGRAVSASLTRNWMGP